MTAETVTLHRAVIKRLLKGPTHRLTKQQWQDVADAMGIAIEPSEQAHPTPMPAGTSIGAPSVRLVTRATET